MRKREYTPFAPRPRTVFPFFPFSFFPLPLFVRPSARRDVRNVNNNYDSYHPPPLPQPRTTVLSFLRLLTPEKPSPEPAGEKKTPKNFHGARRCNHRAPRSVVYEVWPRERVRDSRRALRTRRWRRRRWCGRGREYNTYTCRYIHEINVGGAAPVAVAARVEVRLHT